MAYRMYDWLIVETGIKVKLMKVIQALVLIGCVLNASANAEIYKWRDAKGVMNYSDTPPPGGKQNTQSIKAATVPNDWPLTRSDAYRENAPPASMEAGMKQEQKSAPPEESAAAAEQSLKDVEARIRAQNCAAARSNYRNYAIGGRMQQVNEAGEKEFLTDEQIRQGLEKAQFEIDQNCPFE